MNLYDSTMPWRIPAGAEAIAIYGNGRYAADRNAVARQFPRARIFTIDVMNTDPAGCGIADVENGDMHPADVPGWAGNRLEAHPTALCRIYCNLSTWPAVKNEVARLDARGRASIRYWIANPTGVQHQIPGADATQWLWGDGFDQSDMDAVFAG